MFFFFFFQAADGIRDLNVTGVQTCALPIFYFLTNDATAGLTLSRQPLLDLNGLPELRHFNRVLDVGAIGPGFHTDSVSGFFDRLTRGNSRVRAESGFEKLQDDNSRAFLYLHYQI